MSREEDELELKAQMANTVVFESNRGSGLSSNVGLTEQSRQINSISRPHQVGKSDGKIVHDNTKPRQWIVEVELLKSPLWLEGSLVVEAPADKDAADLTLKDVRALVPAAVMAWKWVKSPVARKP